VAELKRLCEEKGLPVTGKKAELVERLEQAQEVEVGTFEQPKQYSFLRSSFRYSFPN
jgi:hypothetical protein